MPALKIYSIFKEFFIKQVSLQLLKICMEILPGKLLETINSPADLKKLNKEDLPEVCKQLRQYIIDVVSVHGGHFGASLGVVELSVALHYVFDTPYDQLVWLTAIKYLPAGEMFLQLTENIMALVVSQKDRKVNMIRLG